MCLLAPHCALPWSERLCQNTAELEVWCLPHFMQLDSNPNSLYMHPAQHTHIDVSFLLSCSSLGGKTAIHVVC